MTTYTTPTAWLTDEYGVRRSDVDTVYLTVPDVVQTFGESMPHGRAMVYLYANGVDPDTAETVLTHTGPYMIGTRSVCRAVRAARPVAA